MTKLFETDTFEYFADDRNVYRAARYTGGGGYRNHMRFECCIQQLPQLRKLLGITE